MSMVTQCPHCATAFNVTPEQLFARDGQVRCGQCRQVFDGLVNLTSLEALQDGIPPPLAESASAANQAEPAASSSATPVSLGFSPKNWPMLPDVPEVPVPPLPLEVVADKQSYALARASRSDSAEHPGADSLSAQDTPATPQAVDAHEAREAQIAALVNTGPSSTPVVQPAMRQSALSEEIRYNDGDEQPARRTRWPWALAAGLAAIALCGQAVYTFRSELAAHFPAVRPALAQSCEALPLPVRCTVPPLQRPSALIIQASDMLILDKAKPHLVQLIVTMQNQSSLDIGYPAIDLVLNDRFDHALARRVFLPADYLRGDDAQKTVIAASVTATIRINLDVSELNAGGFGLLLIPAPQS